MADHSEYRNYMDDDTVELGCHYCKWQEDGIEDDNAATTLGRYSSTSYLDKKAKREQTEANRKAKR